MQLWFAHRSGVTIREQLVTQIILGILCGDLPPGERLPSTRELARRFRLHPNTISAGYRQLAREQWLEFRRGSGVYVCHTKPEAPLSSALALDQLIANLFRNARELGAPLPALRARLRHWLELQPPDHFLLIEPDEELRRIVALEMQNAVAFPVKTCGPQEAQLPHALEGAIAAALPGRAKAARQALRARISRRVAPRSHHRPRRSSFALARLPQTSPHHANRHRLPSPRPAFPRRPQNPLATRPEKRSRGSLRFCHRHRAAQIPPHRSLPPAGRILPERSAPLSRFHPQSRRSAIVKPQPASLRPRRNPLL